MKLRNVVLAAAFVLAVLSFKSDTTRAGGDMPTGEPRGYPGNEHSNYSREYYRAPYGSNYGYAYGRTYIFGSYYRPYRTHYYSYALPNYYTHYYPRRRRTRSYDRRPRYRAPYSSYSYRYR